MQEHTFNLLASAARESIRHGHLPSCVMSHEYWQSVSPTSAGPPKSNTIPPSAGGINSVVEKLSLDTEDRTAVGCSVQATKKGSTNRLGLRLELDGTSRGTCW